VLRFNEIPLRLPEHLIQQSPIARFIGAVDSLEQERNINNKNKIRYFTKAFLLFILSRSSYISSPFATPCYGSAGIE
jgi:hypothetical protein